jgi:hypothetical protein
MQNRQLSRTTKGILRLAVIFALCCSCVGASAKDPAENTSAQDPFSIYALNARVLEPGHLLSEIVFNPFLYSAGLTYTITVDTNPAGLSFHRRRDNLHIGAEL